MPDTDCPHPDCDRTFYSTGGMRSHHAQVHDACVLNWKPCAYCDHPFVANDVPSTVRYCSKDCGYKGKVAKRAARVVD